MSGEQRPSVLGSIMRVMGALRPLPEREAGEQIPQYLNDPDLIAFMPPSQRLAMHAVQAHAPGELPTVLEFYRNVLPVTLTKMIAFKRLLEVDPMLSDADIYDAHVIGVTYLAEKMQVQAERDLERLIPMLEIAQTEHAPDEVIENLTQEIAQARAKLEESERLTQPAGPLGYYAAVRMHAILSRVGIPAFLVNGIMSNLAHTLNDISRNKTISYQERIQLYDFFLPSTRDSLIVRDQTASLLGFGYTLILGPFLSRLRAEAQSSYRGHPDGPNTLDLWKAQQSALRRGDMSAESLREEAAFIGHAKQWHEQRFQQMIQEARDRRKAPAQSSASSTKPKLNPE